MTVDRNIADPQYVQGQLDALRAIILGLANRLMDPGEFLQESLTRIEIARTAIVHSGASDTWLQGLDDEEAWLRHVVE